jgi:hypothetical protein
MSHGSYRYQARAFIDQLACHYFDGASGTVVIKATIIPYRNMVGDDHGRRIQFQSNNKSTHSRVHYICFEIRIHSPLWWASELVDSGRLFELTVTVVHHGGQVTSRLWSTTLCQFKRPLWWT